MSLSKSERQALSNEYKEEKQRFADLDRQKTNLWLAANDIPKYQRTKILWQDSAKHINKLHRQLYPYFPRTGTCHNCGCDMMSVLGSNPTMTDKCICCNQEVMRY